MVPSTLLVTDHTAAHGCLYPTSLSLPLGLTPETTIPLAALLLEYPVAYVPTSDQAPFLSNIRLDVYECTLDFDHRNADNIGECLLLKFSCPSDLAELHPNRLGSFHIAARLAEKFNNRLKQQVPGATIRVTHSRQTMDRVAL